ncbi:ecm2p [Saccharomyces arboricola H-6]|uniref:Pre-mRNA-splicing factor SLT11 n=1 Tax=Saccharomyces arboricola (strain H-6 / AS 2.3317 / CBS 10644) TaxID=1160507 RepID=J8LRL6_SACAR|nr:ecm2p [Saccharomyces arboricola H-6]
MNDEINELPPKICEQCLGDETNIKMTKIPQGSECKICTLPFTLYHFKTSKRSSFIIKTLICVRCATQRNICQCCMLDSRWHIPVQLRDHLISIVNEENFITEEAKNDMMKRFLSLKDVRLGGAQITSDPSEAENILNKLKSILQRTASDNENSPLQIQGTPALDKNKKYPNEVKNIEKYASVDISHILKKIPLNESFISGISTKSFFLYNIDASIPEWKISDTISQLLNIKKWSDGNSLSLIINHKANCGGIRFQSNEIGEQFASKVHQKITTSKGLSRGVLRIDRFRIFVIPWISGFSAASFGANTTENIKLSLSLNKLIQLEMGLDNKHFPAKNADNTQRNKKNTSKKVQKAKKIKKSKPRASNLEL